MKKRILIVDDELNYLYIMNLMLKENQRYDVRTCHSAPQVPHVAREYKPDLILLDCMMPGMDGGELAGQLQADPQLKDTPFLFLTATVSHVETQASKCYSGLQTYIPKDMKIDDLLRVIEAKLAEGEKRTA